MIWGASIYDLGGGDFCTQKNPAELVVGGGLYPKIWAVKSCTQKKTMPLSKDKIEK
ncbi:hypothetical protein Cylst_5495 [Cylindrospermum stagnale PCC 7417]|uniref:Uncharacterized protein n=1 Tax=Cylindrospermum stagnale PCC 7417 TaxID=56107 RepID=K9X5Z7_9NOST|nr:hypothetical protein Cylst_5495 [Cylindrospermum stagnale PCC 7417]